MSAKNKGMRIAVILPSLAGGGMERMRLHLIDEWMREGIKIDLVVSVCTGDLRGQVPAGVEVFEVAARHPMYFPIGLASYLKKRQPTHILAAGPDVNAITLLVAGVLARKTPVTVSFHNHISSELQFASGISAIKGQATVCALRYLIKDCTRVVAISHGVAEDLRKHFPSERTKITVIYNPVVTRHFRDGLRAVPDTDIDLDGIPWLIYVGRLTHSKGIDVLITAFGEVSRKSNAHLVVMGSGPYKSVLKEIKEKNGFGHRIHVYDYQKNPLPYIRGASVLVLPSRHEGLANVIIEALACGTQVVATDCPAGPSEILEGGKFGQLVPVGDSSALSDAILRSLNQEFWVDPEKLQQRGLSFSSKRAANQYLSVLTGRRIEG